MPSNNRDEVLEGAIDALSATGDDALTKAATEGMPEREAVVAWVERCKRLVLTQRDTSALRSEVPALVDRLQGLLSEVGVGGRDTEEVALAFVGQLPAIRALLAEDVEAAFEGDPAAKSFAEIVVSYPSIRAIAIYRIAHELQRLAVPILPRMMTEKAHDRTGIDIHPGARIGRRFFIDHGMGVVIGETAEVGDDVMLYHGVTLGGRTRDGGKRHPTLEDGVAGGAGAKILGPSVIGANAVVTKDAPSDSVLVGVPARARRRAVGEDTRAILTAPEYHI